MFVGKQPPPQQAVAATSTAEEEALKRNTDCIYFLASPLTCKKGSECEYRHSEYARVNPRDCYYWLNGNCLNPKCSFRHPPLDGLLGTQGALAGSALSSSQPAAILTTNASRTVAKQAAPCIFFQKGTCLKGDKCAFSHGPNPTINKAPMMSAAPPSVGPPTFKNPVGGLENKFAQVHKPKSVEVPPVVKLDPKSEFVPMRNGVSNGRRIQPTGLGDVPPSYNTSNFPPTSNVDFSSRSYHLQQTHGPDNHPNYKDNDESLRESSPGFDVLVDDEIEDSDHYHDENQFGSRIHKRRDLNTGREYDIGLSADYGSRVDVDEEVFHDPHGYGSYDSAKGQYGWKQHGSSSERTLMSAHPERKGYGRAGSPDRINESDLRHQLSKHRRVNGLRSVVSKDHVIDNHAEERGYKSSSRRDAHHLPLRESFLSSRLRGRIKLPVNDSNSHTEMEMDRERNRGRLSRGRPQSFSQHSRLRDRIKGRVQDEYNNEEWNLRSPRMSREVMDEATTDFAAPKSLSELKGVKMEQQFSGKRKSNKIEDDPQSEAFAGPKPLSEILKRKRGAVLSSAVVATSSDDQDKQDNFLSSSNIPAVGEKESDPIVASKVEADSQGASNKETLTSGIDNNSSQALNNESGLEYEDGLIGDEGIEDHEYEADDQGQEGLYDYDYEEGENVDQDEEYLEDEDGDDFAKKIGVTL